MYMGEVHINNEDLVDFIEMAEQFKIRGVTKEQTVRIKMISQLSNSRTKCISYDVVYYFRVRMYGVTI